MLDNLTVGDLMSIITALSGQQAPQQSHPFLGQYVICRASGAGVHSGVLISATPRDSSYEVVLGGSRRLWSWVAKGGVALSGVAVFGIKSGKIDAALDKIAITGVVEIIPCTAISRETIDAA